MTLRTRLLWLFIPLLLLVLLTVYLLSDRLLLARTDRQDAQRLHETAALVHNSLLLHSQRQLAILRNLAWRSGAASASVAGEQEERLAELGLDFVLQVDRQGRIVAQQWLPAVPHALRQQLLDRVRAPEAAQEAQVRLLWIEQNALLLLGSPLGNHANARDGRLIAGKLYDSAALDNLQLLINGLVRLSPPNAADRAWPLLESRLEAPPLVARIGPRHLPDAAQQQLELQLDSPSGDDGLRVQITLPREHYLQAKSDLLVFLSMTLLTAALAMLLAYLGLEYWILRRLQRLQHEVSTIGLSPDAARLSEQGDDELGTLGQALNRMLERLESSEARDRAILDSIADGYFEIAAGGVILAVNPGLERQLGYSAEELIGRRLSDILGEEELQRARNQLMQVMRGEAGPTFAAPIRRRDGSTGYFETRLSLVRDARGGYSGLRGILHDIGDQVAYQQQLYDMAHRDPLTGLGNRMAFNNQLQLSHEQARQSDGTLALLYMDLDRFKDVNDRFGHILGDALLIAFSERLRGALRQPDHLYRLGGDEFTVLLPGSDRAEAIQIVRRLLDVLRSPYELHGQHIDFATPSIGIALYPEHADSPQALLGAADEAMYQAKLQHTGYHIAALFDD